MNSSEANAVSLRNWMTAEEFLAAVEAYQRMRLQHPLKATQPFVPGPFVRTYVLKWNLRFTPKIKAPTTLKSEVAP